jgi:hypothetical protein
MVVYFGLGLPKPALKLAIALAPAIALSWS